MSTSTKRSRSSRRKTRRSSSASKRQPRVFISYQRQKEVLGLILMALSVLLGLAIVTYSPLDNALVGAASLADAFDPSANRARNALGIFGAHLAWVLVPKFLGYPVLVLPGLLFAWGYVIFRSRPVVRLPWLTLIGVVGLLIVSSFLGWFDYVTSYDMSVWSGAFGLGLSGGLQRAFGTIGSMVLLLLFTAIILLLVIDYDVQRTLDRVDHAILAVRAWFNEKTTQWQQRRAVRKEARAKKHAEYLALREAKQKELEKARAQLTPASPPSPNKPAATARPTPDDSARSRPVSAPASELPTFRPTPAPSAGSQVPILNDLYRPPVRSAADAPASSTLKPASSLPPSPPPPAPAATPSSKTPDSEPETTSTPASTPESEVAFSVRERVQELKANLDEREPDVEVEELPYQFPSVELLEEDEGTDDNIDYTELEEKKQLLIEKLNMHNIQLSNISAVVGPTVTLYELKPAPGIKISQIKSLENDLAMAMAARGIRMIAPIPGKSAVGVEIPNRYRELVRIRSVLNTARFRDAKMELPIILGKTIENEVYIADLTKMPHLLMAGATGSGKSVGLNCLIATLLYACHPSNLKFVMIDPKKIELQQYARVLDQFIAMPEDVEEAITTDFAQANGLLKSCLQEMEDRYDLLSDAGVRGIKEYNKRFQLGRLNEEEGHHHLPYIVVIVDELADLMMTAGKEIEGPIARLAQMARAVGIHMVVATQRPSVNVITGLIKANFPSRIAFQVASGVDSRTIIDQYGAEQLVGNGDMLFMNGSRLMRLQSPFISLEEVEAVTQFIGDQPGTGPYFLPAVDAASGPDASAAGSSDEDRDKLFDEAARIIVRSQQGSVSLLQRKLSVGYTRAARIVDQLEDAGIVGPFEGSKARQVLVPNEMELDAFLKELHA